MIDTNKAIILSANIASGNRALRTILQNVLNKKYMVDNVLKNFAVGRILCTQEPILQLQMLSTDLA